MDSDEGHYRNWTARSPEIVEIGEDSKSIVLDSSTTRDGVVVANDVYVAVGKNDLHVVKYALDRVVVSPESRIFLVHVFAPLSYIPTPVGRLSRSQLSKDQVQVYIREESNRRRNMLQKYISLCNESKIAVDTMLVESNSSAKAILELIPVVNISYLVMGTGQSPFTRLSRKGLGKGEYIKKNAPDFCEVILVYGGKTTKGDQQEQKTVREVVPSMPNGVAAKTGERPQASSRTSERNFFECVCFTGKST